MAESRPVPDGIEIRVTSRIRLRRLWGCCSRTRKSVAPHRHAIGISHPEEAMLELLERQQRLTVDQWKIISAAILGDMLHFFDFFLIWSAERPVTERRDGFRPLRAAPETARKAA
jgi:hypothetical protein